MTDDESSRLRESAWPWVACLLAVYLVITPWNIQNQSVSNPDEPLYAASAREMMRGGDKLIPEFNTKPRLVKPIMIYWVLIAGGAIGSAFGLPLLTALHLGPLFMGLLAALGTFLIGKQLRGARFGYMTAMLLITAHRFHDLARALLVDMTLTAFLVWAWYCFLVALDRLERRTEACIALLGCYLCLGAACMTKGPVLTAVFAVAPMLAYIFWTRRARIIMHAGLWWGVPVALISGFWWFALLAWRGHGDDVYCFFTTQNFGRFVSAEGADGHPWPYLFYIGSLGDAFLPWALLLPPVWWLTWRGWRILPSSGLSWQARFLICALVIPFAVVGLSINKRSVYLLPLYPFLAMYVVWAVEDAWLSRGKKERSVGLRTDWRYRTALLVLAAVALLNLGLEIFVRPVREKFYARSDFYEQVNRVSAGRPVMFCGLDINEAVWYLDRPQQAIEECMHTQLGAGYLPPADHVLVVREDFLERHPELQHKLTILDSKLRTRNITYYAAVGAPRQTQSANDKN